MCGSKHTRYRRLIMVTHPHVLEKIALGYESTILITDRFIVRPRNGLPRNAFIMMSLMITENISSIGRSLANRWVIRHPPRTMSIRDVFRINSVRSPRCHLCQIGLYVTGPSFAPLVDGWFTDGLEIRESIETGCADGDTNNVSDGSTHKCRTPGSTTIRCNTRLR